MSNTLELRGRTVIVTGASSGIGEATARTLHAADARPVLAARRTERLKTLSAQLGGALYVQTDVTDAGRVAHLVAATLKRHGASTLWSTTPARA
jgi:NADP-dependent 3-hydroxy acid dehydrogenase YdfG